MIRGRARIVGLLLAAALVAGALFGVSAVVGFRGASAGPDAFAGEGLFAYGGHHGSAALVKESIARDRKIMRCAALAFRGTRRKGCAPIRAMPGKARRGVQQAAALSDTGQWSQPFQYPTASLVAGGGGSGNPTVAIHQVVLPTGKVLFFAYPYTRYDIASNMSTYAWLWDPSQGVGPSAFKEVDPPINPATGLPFNLWCGGQTMLPDGRVVVVGGTLRYENKLVKTNGQDGDNHLGLNVIVTFNPFTETWALQHDILGNHELMVSGRWYPTVVTLPDGRVLITSGRDSSVQDNGATVPEVEVFTPSPDPNGTNGTVFKAPASADRVVGLYPHLFVLPSNTQAGAGSTPQQPKVLLAGPHQNPTNDSAILDTKTWTWTNVPGLDRNRDYGTAVLMPGGTSGPTEVRVFGGGTNADNESLKLDLNNWTQGWTPAPNMNIARSHLNTVILPDGGLFSFGGGLGVGAGPNQENPNYPYPGATGDNYRVSPGNPPPQWTSELWSAATNAWASVDTQRQFRTYHSTGVLLPDATVLSAGDDRPSYQPLGARTAEIYSPPYLFKGARPSITKAPIGAGYGQSFLVSTPDQVSGAVLVAPGAVTHAVDMNQHSLQLAVSPAAGGVNVSTPTNQTALPPGYYMLFLLNAQGVPSVASWVRVDPATAAPVYAPDPAAPGASAGSGAGSAGSGGAAAALTPSTKAAGKTLGKVKVTLSKVKITRRGRWLVASFVLRGKTAFTGKAKLGRLGKKSKLLPPVASKKVRAATVKKAKAVPMKLTMKAPKTNAKLRLGLKVELSAKGARATTLSRSLAVPRAR